MELGTDLVHFGERAGKINCSNIWLQGTKPDPKDSICFLKDPDYIQE